jgi:hypothetical protein
MRRFTHSALRPRRTNLALTLTTLVLAAGTLVSCPGTVPAAEDLSHIHLSYRGGRLIQHVQVATLFWGRQWQRSTTPAYLSAFFTALFVDGGFMANLSQYSAGGYSIGNGLLVGCDVDPADLPSQVTEDQVRAEIRSEFAAGYLPKPTADSLYVVYTPADVEVVDDQGSSSLDDFDGFHDYDAQGRFAFALITVTSTASQATAPTSHELAEAVTDPQVNSGILGWYDDNNGEVGDIPQELSEANQLDESGLFDVLRGADGSKYQVQRVWSVRDGRPIAFAPTANQSNSAPGQ